MAPGAGFPGPTPVTAVEVLSSDGAAVRVTADTEYQLCGPDEVEIGRGLAWVANGCPGRALSVRLPRGVVEVPAGCRSAVSVSPSGLGLVAALEGCPVVSAGGRRTEVPEGGVVSVGLMGAQVLAGMGPGVLVAGTWIEANRRLDAALSTGATPPALVPVAPPETVAEAEPQPQPVASPPPESALSALEPPSLEPPPPAVVRPAALPPPLVPARQVVRLPAPPSPPPPVPPAHAPAPAAAGPAPGPGRAGLPRALPWVAIGLVLALAGLTAGLTAGLSGGGSGRGPGPRPVVATPSTAAGSRPRAAGSGTVPSTLAKGSAGSSSTTTSTAPASSPTAPSTTAAGSASAGASGAGSAPVVKLDSCSHPPGALEMSGTAANPGGQAMRFSITGTFAAADGSPLGTRTVPVVLQAGQEVSWSMSMAYGGAAPGHCQMSYTAAPAQ